MADRVKEELFEDEENIWEFIYLKIVEEAKFTEVTDRVWGEYLRENGKIYWDVSDIREHYETEMVKTLHKSFMEDHKILALFKALKIPFPEDVEKFFERRVSVKLKVRHEILIDYRLPSTYVIQETKKKSTTIVPEIDQYYEISKELEDKMWKHVDENLGKIKNCNFATVSFWMKLADELQIRTFIGYDMAKHFIVLLRSCWSRNMNLKLKMGLLTDLKFRMSETIRQSMLSMYNVEIVLDDNGFIEKWKLIRENEPATQDSPSKRITQNLPPSKTRIKIGRWHYPVGTLSFYDHESDENDQPDLNSEHATSSETSPATKEKTPSLLDDNDSESEEEDKDETYKVQAKMTGRSAFLPYDRLEMAKFLYDEIFHGEDDEIKEIQPKGLTIWKKYITKYKSSRTAANLSSNYRKSFQSILHTVELPREKILKLYKHLKIEVDHSTKEILQKKFKANVEYVGNFVFSWTFVEKSNETPCLSPPKKRTRQQTPDSSPEFDPKSEQGTSRGATRDLRSSMRTNSSAENGRNRENRRENEKDEENEKVENEDEEEREMEQNSNSSDDWDNTKWIQEYGVSNRSIPLSGYLRNMKEENEEIGMAEAEEIDRLAQEKLDELNETAKQILSEDIQLQVPDNVQKDYEKQLEEILELCKKYAKDEEKFLEMVQHFKSEFKKRIEFLCS